MITVFGSFVVDLVCNAKRHPIPGETILADFFDMGPGGKGQNQAVQAKLAGSDVKFITKIGKDELASVGTNFWKQIGLDYTAFVHDTEKTGAALIMVDSTTAQNMISVAPGACMTFTTDELNQAFTDIAQSNIFLTQLETNLDACFEGIKRAHASGVLTILNPAPMTEVPVSVLSMVDIFTPNESEAAVALNWAQVDKHNAKDACDEFFKMGVKSCIITLGKDGCFIANKSVSKLIPSFKVNAVDTTGAGDSFNGALAAFLDQGCSLEQAAVKAQAAAALSVTSHGTAKAMKGLKEINDFLANQKI